MNYGWEREIVPHPENMHGFEPDADVEIPTVYDNEIPPGPVVDGEAVEDENIAPINLYDHFRTVFNHLHVADATLSMIGRLQIQVNLNDRVLVWRLVNHLIMANEETFNRFILNHPFRISLRFRGFYFRRNGFDDWEELREHTNTAVVDFLYPADGDIDDGNMEDALDDAIDEWINLMMDSGPIFFFINEIEVLAVHDHQPPAAGCISRTREKIITKNGMFVKNLYSSSNNCFFVCLNYGVMQLYGEVKVAKITKTMVNMLRSRVNLGPKDLIPLDPMIIAKMIQLIYARAHFPFYLEIYNEEAERLLTYEHGEPNEHKIVRLLYKDNHLSYIVSLDYKTNICSNCGQKYKQHHGLCNVNRVSFYKKRKNNVNYVAIKKSHQLAEGQEDPPLVIFDFETAPFETRHQAFALGIMDTEGTYYYFYGVKEVHDAFKFIGENPVKFAGTWVAHNGGRFDFHFLLSFFDFYNDLYHVDNMIYANGRFISIDVTLKLIEKKIRLWDTINFISADLRRACDNFGLNTKDMEKGVFPYFFIDKEEKLNYSGPPPADQFYTAKDRFNKKIPQYPPDYIWSTKDETLKYLELDVRCLSALAKKFGSIIKENFNNENIFEYVTLPQFSYARWTGTLKKFSIEATVDHTKQKFYRESLYGGRIILNRWMWKSAQYDKIINKEITYDEITDYYLPMDVNGLYSSVMLEGFHYPIGLGTEHGNPDIFLYHPERLKEFFIADIYIVPNKKLAHALLPRREGGRLVWDNSPRRGTYTSVDINFALSYGYKITKWYKVIEFHAAEEVFKNWITDCNTLRQKGTDENNPALKNTGKLAANATYGKTTQHEKKESTVAIYTPQDLAEFFKMHKWKDYIQMDNYFFMIGEKRETRRYETSRIGQAKPIQLGAFVTAYARNWMFKILAHIDPTLEEKNNLFAYMDTDSLHIHASVLHKLEEFPTIDKDKFGAMKNDIKGLRAEKIKIIAGNWLSPKCYREVYIDNDLIIHDNLKAKGVPNWSITPEFFKKVEENPDYVEQLFFDSLQGSSLKPIEKQNHSALSFYNTKRSRTLNKTKYQGGIREVDGTFSIICNEAPDSPSNMPMELDDEQQEEEEKIANSEEEDREYSQSFQDVFWNEDLDSLLL